MNRRFLTGLALCAGLALTAATSAAATTLSLRDAIAATQARNPQLQSHALRAEALDHERDRAAKRPAPELGLEAENLGLGNEAEYTLALSQVIELGGDRRARIGVADSRRQQQAAQRRIAELDLLAEVSRRFVAVATAEHQRQLAARALQLARDAEQAVTRQQRAGRAAAAELSRASATLARRQLTAGDTQQQLSAARLRLAAMWGDEQPGFDRVAADLLAVAPPAPLHELLATLSDQPDLALLASEQRLRDAELLLARAGASADPEWSLGLRHLEASGDNALVLGLSLPLFSPSRGRPGIAAATAERSAAEQRQAAAGIERRALLYALHGELRQAVSTVTTLRERVLPLLRDAQTQSREAYLRGRYSYQDWSAAQQQLLDVERELIDTASRAHQLRIELERLTGAPLPLRAPANRLSGVSS